MKLYREVKANERLPKEDIEGFVIEENKYILYASGIRQDGVWFDSRSGNVIDVDVWLEPIEITEEEVVKIIRDVENKAVEEDEDATIGEVHILQAKAILRLLTDEK